MGILVTRSTLPEYEEYCEQIKKIWDTHWLTNMGAMHEELSSKLSDFLGTEYLSLFVNGHLALESIIQAFSFKPGSEVITTPFSFASTTHAIVRCGLKPVFCDIDSSSWCLDPKKIESLITEKTVAILPVHVYGTVCDHKAIEEIAKKNNLKVIYDSAHAFAETENGVSVAQFGDAAMFSFHATKTFNTIEGGCAIVHSEEMRQKLDDCKNYGIRGPEEVVFVGGNAKMNEFQAAMGLCNLKHLDESINKRAKADRIYREELGNIKGITLRVVQEGVKSNYSYFPVLFDSYKYTRDEVFDRLAKEGIGTRKYFFPLINDFDCYKDNYSSKDTPVAKEIAERVLCLPMYPDLKEEDIRRICKLIKD